VDPAHFLSSPTISGDSCPAFGFRNPAINIQLIVASEIRYLTASGAVDGCAPEGATLCDSHAVPHSLGALERR